MPTSVLVPTIIERARTCVAHAPSPLGPPKRSPCEFNRRNAHLLGDVALALARPGEESGAFAWALFLLAEASLARAALGVPEVPACDAEAGQEGDSPPRADALLAHALVLWQAAVGEASEPPVELTPREHDVLVLVANGACNREIGEALGISPRTAASHVAHITGKLGVGSRAAAAASAVRRGLA